MEIMQNWNAYINTYVYRHTYIHKQKLETQEKKHKLITPYDLFKVLRNLNLWYALTANAKIIKKMYNYKNSKTKT